MKLEAIEHARFRALSQLIIDKDKGIDAFEEYMKVAFPYLAAGKKHEREWFTNRVKEEIARGPMGIRPMVAPRMRSRITEAKAKRTKPLTAAEEQSLYRKIGRSI